MLAPVLFLLLGGTGAAALEPMTSAEFCGRCHRAIYDAWKGSAHAAAMQSTLFQDALEAAEQDGGSGVRKTCLTCHAPASVVLSDTRLQRKVSWEGVTCDYCHSMRDASTHGASARPRIETTGIRLGPIKDAVSSAHGTAFSELHASSALCATCHEYRNPLGFQVLKTFSEWSATRHAKAGTTCQSCHMDGVAGTVVDPRIARSHGAQVNLHQMPGSHSLPQLTKTIRARLDSVHEANEILITVELANRGAGHSMPTGSPLRKVILEVRADAADGRHFTGQKTYERVVVDAKGMPVGREHLAFLRAAREVSDTRLASDEIRTETFRFPIAKGVSTQVTALLHYVYSPLAAAETPQRLTFLRLSRLVP